MSEWIGVDLDGTLAKTVPMDQFNGDPDQIGEPVLAMIEMIKKFIAQGKQVKIFTTRATSKTRIEKIQEWLLAHGLPALECTNIKDEFLTVFYDDRCFRVERNTGKIL